MPDISFEITNSSSDKIKLVEFHPPTGKWTHMVPAELDGGNWDTDGELKMADGNTGYFVYRRLSDLDYRCDFSYKNNQLTATVSFPPGKLASVTVTGDSLSFEVYQ